MSKGSCQISIRMRAYSSGWDREGEVTTHTFTLRTWQWDKTKILETNLCSIWINSPQSTTGFSQTWERQYAVSHHLIHEHLCCAVLRNTEQISIYFLQIHISVDHSYRNYYSDGPRSKFSRSCGSWQTSEAVCVCVWFSILRSEIIYQLENLHLFYSMQKIPTRREIEHKKVSERPRLRGLKIAPPNGKQNSLNRKWEANICVLETLHEKILNSPIQIPHKFWVSVIYCCTY